MLRSETMTYIDQGCYVGWIYINYWLMNVSGFFVHQWDVRMRDLFTVLYVSPQTRTTTLLVKVALLIVKR